MSKVKLHTLYKPNGTKINVNDSSLSHAKELGWTKTNPKAKAKEDPKTD